MTRREPECIAGFLFTEWLLWLRDENPFPAEWCLFTAAQLAACSAWMFARVNRRRRAREMTAGAAHKRTVRRLIRSIPTHSEMSYLFCLAFRSAAVLADRYRRLDRLRRHSIRVAPFPALCFHSKALFVRSGFALVYHRNYKAKPKRKRNSRFRLV